MGSLEPKDNSSPRYQNVNLDQTLADASGLWILLFVWDLKKL
jgi:hypothetical protein